MENFYKDTYKNILRLLENLRQSSVSQWSDVLAYGGSIPAEVSEELATASKITGEIFSILPRYGVSVTPSPVKPGMVQVSIDGEVFTCHESAISGVPAVTPAPAPIPTPAAAPQPPYLEQPQVYPEQPSQAYADPISTITPSPSYEANSYAAEQDSDDEDWEDYDDDASGTNNPIAPLVEEPAKDDFFSAFDAASQQQTVNNEADDEDWEDWEDSAEEAPVQQTFAQPEENDDTSFASLTSFDSFLDEKSKIAKSLVYESFVLNMTHSGLVGGGRAEEFRVMIAPLKIYPVNAPSVPIIVAIFHNNKVTIKSSYNNEDGNNSVMIDESEFYFLARGSFDANGNFGAFFTTTGISATQGDIMNIVSRKTFGNEAGSKVGNGHLKVRATLYDEPGVIEVFPFGDVGENDFIIMSRTENFVEYSFIMPPSTTKYIVQGAKKKKNVVTCAWSDDILSLNLEEV